MTRKSTKFLCGAAIAGSFLLANYAAQHHWPLEVITLAGAISLVAVVAYIMMMQSP